MLKRKHPSFVRIVQISDLHFDEATRFPGKADADPNLLKLAEDIVAQCPDIVCVTGDIADRAIAEKAGKEGKAFRDWFLRERRESYEAFLKRLWTDSKRFFIESLCRNQEHGAPLLMVIPGNHDYRLQGFLGNDAEAIRLFKECFADQFCNRRASFEYEGYPPISVDIVSIDSNLGAKSEDLATGAISEVELGKFRFFDDPGAEGSGGFRFRVCLVHHHPLPVVPAESTRVRDDEPGVGDRIKQIPGMMTGPQTTLLRNAGTFLGAALSRNVDLVLHGHDHHAWVTEVGYPRTSGSHRMIVAAAGSTGKLTDSRYTYNIADLGRDGTVQVRKRTIEKNLQRYRDEEAFPVYPQGQIRAIRWEKTTAALRGDAKSADNPSDIRPGEVEAERISRVVEIDEAGNILSSYQFDGFRPTNKPVKTYPLPIFSPGSYVSIGEKVDVKVTASPAGRPYQATAVLAQVGEQSGSASWEIQFSPEVTPEAPVSFSLCFRQCNAYEFTQEERRARVEVDSPELTRDDCESITTRARRVFPKRILQTVVFPAGWLPPGDPTIRIYDPKGQQDPVETDYCAHWFQYLPQTRSATLKVDLPLPGLIYEIAWPLQARETFDRERFTEDSLYELRGIASRAWDGATESALNKILDDLRTEVSAEIRGVTRSVTDHTTEFGLFIVQHKFADSKSGQVVRVSLKRFASVLSPSSPESYPLIEDIPHGVGLAGQALRTARVIMDRSGQSGLYGMLAGQSRRHEFLCAIPLPIHPAEGGEAGRLKPAVFGVLCLGSYESGSGLEQLAQKSPACLAAKAALFDRIQGTFARQVLNLLQRPPSNPQKGAD